MSPHACQILTDQILPVLARTVPRAVRPARGEDAAELVQDAVATAANMLQATENSGRDPIPASIVYYSVQRLKAGRRSTSCSTVDVLSPFARQLNGFAVVSLDAPAAGAPDADTDGMCLADLLACRRDDPATEAQRHADWAGFLATQGERENAILHDLAAGFRQTETAARLGVSEPRITQIKADIGREARARLGADVLAVAVEEPRWRRDLRAKAERRARASRGVARTS